MKKSNLNVSMPQIGVALTRSQLKKVIGGNLTASTDCHSGACQSNADCPPQSCSECVPMFPGGSFKFCTFP
jgi:hypothetical protein